MNKNIDILTIEIIDTARRVRISEDPVERRAYAGVIAGMAEELISYMEKSNGQ